MPSSPKLTIRADGNKLKATVTLAKGITPQRNTLSWCVNRHRPYTLSTEYDHWESASLTAGSDGTFTAEIETPATANTIDFVSTHMHEENGLPFHFSSHYTRWSK